MAAAAPSFDVEVLGVERRVAEHAGRGGGGAMGARNHRIELQVAGI
jgi:hypothetical protein